MALDQDYFDSIHIDVVKRKYYNVNKVEAVLTDIRRQALALQAENEELRRKLEEKSDPSAELTDAIYSAQSVYRSIVERANQRAEAILEQAEQQRLAILDENQRQRDQAVQAVEQCMQRLRDQQQESLTMINAVWQDFLCGLYPEDGPALDKPKGPEEAAISDIPADLDEKVGAIARELLSMEE